MAGLTPMFTEQQVGRWINKFGDKSLEKMERVLAYAGELFVRMARENGEYRDITGNLRSSIGYVVAQDGEILHDNYKVASKGTDGEEGVQKARQLARELVQTHNKGLVLIGLAGMEYAVHVENIKGKDVISSSEEFAKQTAKELLKKTLNG